MSAADRRGRIPRILVSVGLRRPGLVLGSWALAGLVCGIAALGLRVETSTDSVLDHASEAWGFYQRSLEKFGGDEVLVLLLAGDAPYDERTLRAVAEATRSLEGLEGVRRVDSVASVPLVSTSERDGLSLEPRWQELLEERSRAGREARRALGGDRVARRLLVSDDFRSFAVNVFLDAGAEPHYETIIGEMERLAAKYSGVVSGVPVFRFRTDERTRRELALFVPATLGILSLLVLLQFGSLRAVVIALSSGVLGVLIVFGAMAVAEVPLTISTVILPSVLLALGAAYSMHLLAAGAGKAGASELKPAMGQVALPVALSGLTTCVGFLAVSFVRIDAISQLGGFGALGVLAVLAATLTLGPALLAMLPLPARRMRLRKALSGALGGVLVRAVERRGGLIVVAWLASGAVLAVGLARLNVETDVIQWFPDDDPVRISYNVIRDDLSGISPMNVVIEAPADRTVTAPESVRAVRNLAAHLEELSTVGRVLSFLDPLDELDEVIRGDGDGRSLEDEALVEQYLLLLEGKPFLGDLLARDRSAANLVIRADDNGSRDLLDIAGDAETWWEQHGPKGYSAQVTGIMYEFARSEDEIAYGQIRGLAFALGTIAIVLLGAFRSFGVAGAALVPNALPIAAAYGAMGVLGIPLDAGTVALGNLALGIAVDDTVHVAEGFQRRVDQGFAPLVALKETFVEVLPAICFTSVAVGVGFGVLAMSEFVLVRNLGALTAVVMATCLVADTTLLPALLLAVRRRGDRFRAR